MRIAAVLGALVVVGCGTDRRAAPPMSPAAPEAPPAPTAAPAPAALYAECEPRVEQPQADRECTTDAQCARGGCGNVVCTTATAAVDLMTTCEDLPCFAVLDTCGCHDGRCTWTVAARPGGEPAP